MKKWVAGLALCLAPLFAHAGDSPLPPVLRIIIDPVAGPGFGYQYPRDKGICGDPRVIYCETWDENPQDWWKKTNGRYVLHRPSRWRNSNGVYLHSDWLYTTFEPTGGLVGAGLRNTIQGDRMGGTYSPTVWLLREYDHLFFRYYLKFHENFRDAVGAGCDGGKLPGFVSSADWGISNGMNNWNLRQDYRLNCDKRNPMYPRVRIVTYAYHGDKLGVYPGDDWTWTGKGELGLANLGQWHCLEGEVKVNTPGKRDGVWRVWWDGQPAAERAIFLRDVRPPQGYGDWRLVTATATGPVTFTSPATNRAFWLGSRGASPNDNLGIKTWVGTLHHGGRTVMGVDADVTIDQVVVATQRVGCTAL